jgi:hypothetical protein
MEESFYLYLAGPYRGLSPADAQVLLVERVEGMIAADIARFASLGQTAKSAVEPDADPAASPPNPTPQT